MPEHDPNGERDKTPSQHQVLPLSSQPSENAKPAAPDASDENGVSAESPLSDFLKTPGQTGGGACGCILLTLPLTVIMMFYLPIIVVLILYIGTVIWATMVAVRSQFHKYRLGGPANGPSTFLSCLLLWTIGFPWFFANMYRVKEQKAELKQPNDKTRASTIILPLVGLIVTAVGIWFLFQVAPSSRSTSREIAKTASAITMLKAYASAQLAYKNGKFGELSGGATYCDNFRNLHYFQPQGSTSPLNLLPKVMADAFAGPTAGAPTAGDAPATPTPYSGYLFLEAPVVQDADWNDTFALVAYPAKIDPARPNALPFIWTDSSGDLYMSQSFRYGTPIKVDAQGKPILLQPEDSPLANPHKWFLIGSSGDRPRNAKGPSQGLY